MPSISFERELTAGGIGTLWLGRLVAGAEAGRTVLLRRMPKERFSAKDIDALKKVAKAYSKVRHPSLVKLLGVVEQDDDIISVSEHLDGARWCDLMRCAITTDTPLSATVAVRVILDAARATLTAHRLAAESGLFPAERLLVSESIFVASFGGTLLTETGVLAALTRCTQSRSIPAVVAQLAPEELEGSKPSKGSPEVFSLGVLLWEALANRYLVSRDEVGQTLEDLQSRAVTPLNQFERFGIPVPDALTEIVRVATHRQPSQRFASVNEFVSALEDLPTHFLATEHLVACTLREQAAELLREFRAEPSQASLTLPFSEVRGSGASTQPPPDDEHDWERPTFAQRQLVAPERLANSIPTAALSVPSPQLSRDSEPPVATSIPTQSRKYAIGAGVALVAISVALLLTQAIQDDASLPQAVPATQAITLAPSAPAAPSLKSGGSLRSGGSSRSGDGPLHETLAAPNGAEATGASTSHSTFEQKGSRSKKSALDSASSVPTARSSGSPASPKADATFRPQQIAPYRPKGI